MLTPAQRQTLKTAIQADPTANTLFVDGNLDGLAEHLNALASPAFHVWNPSTPVDAINDQIIGANLTPTGGGTLDTAAVVRALVCQSKQLSLNTLLVGRETVNASKPRIRGTLQDALTDIPSGNNGNLRQGGWTQVQIAMTRQATRFERVFANTTDGNGAANTTPALLVVIGPLPSTELIGL